MKSDGGIRKGGPTGMTAQSGAQTFKIFSTGLPAIPLHGAARIFEEMHGVRFKIVAGEPSTWLPRVRDGEGDLVCVGAEYMMDDIEAEGLILRETRATVGYRRSMIMVRRGNPRGIRTIQDLAEMDVKLLVCRGACQKGLWDDVASKAMVTDKIRSKIAEYGAGCLDTLRRWRRSEGRIDAGIVWNVYGRVWPAYCEMIELPRDIEVFRSTNVAILKSCSNRESLQDFVGFLRSDESRRVYEKWGWITKKP
ncbi:MAG: substrate-binding domain-containing protein [Candidatus Brockarchaeota archaeon]|nr:substrate-binding domain-containing protein [Candidatus Brockarchaeota archaeon]